MCVLFNTYLYFNFKTTNSELTFLNIFFKYLQAYNLFLSENIEINSV